MSASGWLGPEQAANTTPVTHPLQPRVGSRSTNAARFGALRPYLEGRRVLDLGAARGIHHADWLHGRVCEVAARAVAVDIDREGIAELERRGLVGFVADASDYDLDERFDVVLAGELIEHLVDVRGFLDCARRHLEPGGRLILTTPNPFAVTNFLYRLGSHPAPINPDHTCWFCADTLPRLLVKAGFLTESVAYIRHDTSGRLRRIVATAIRGALPDRLAWRTLMVVARPAE